MNRFLLHVFPEIDRFPTPADAEQALKKAMSHRRSWVIGLSFSIIIIYCLALALMFEFMDRNTVYYTWLPPLMILLIPLFYMMLLGWPFRRHIQRSLREQLAESGIPVCIQCGYDLTGNESGMCPECGNEFAERFRPYD